MADHKGESPLHVLMINSDDAKKQRVVASLLAAGADLEARNKYGSTPLHRAAYFGHPETVKQLVEAGAALTAKDLEGLTPLEYALKEHEIEKGKGKELSAGLSQSLAYLEECLIKRQAIRRQW